MQIHSDINKLPAIKYPVVTSGTFDGVHVGHQKILKRIDQLSEERKGESVVLTFWPHPRYVLSNDHSLKLLSTIEEKIYHLEKSNIDHLIIIPFTKEFSQLTSEEFIQEILIKKIGTKMLVIGYDHHFGKNREGSFEYLIANKQNYPFEIEEIPEQDIHDIAVSSTKIRNALMEGNVEIAEEFLGKPYSLRGTVVKGDQIGRTLGYPTANLYIKETFKLIPADGIYAALISVENVIHQGLVYIGNRPTLQGVKKAIEAFIFDFQKDIYEEAIGVSLLKFIRGDQNFVGLEELKEQMKKDEEAARKYFQTFIPKV
jgi:riboflavin kinase / FMN adenylyltransferase